MGRRMVERGGHGADRRTGGQRTTLRATFKGGRRDTVSLSSSIVTSHDCTRIAVVRLVTALPLLRDMVEGRCTLHA